ncbi:ATPase inhibitor, mitochondrial-like [Actinia tenebrosa]|uniref:ATP synthase F1 subunit epsilon n=1 Tax=Actinia tenebrosa TaxID=6105 RepID=A0A6P8I3I4_ACTTE|nr:ATPase inhibitor, mitochondrial-like [Actinia tenebrosa]
MRLVREIKMAAYRAVVGRLFALSRPVCLVRMMSGEMGSGSGRGGGGGGTIRDAGGAFGKMEHAHEEQYFRQLQQQQLEALREQQKHMIETIEKEIEHHEESIKRNKEQLAKYHKLMQKSDSKGSGSDSD